MSIETYSFPDTPIRTIALKYEGKQEEKKENENAIQLFLVGRCPLKY